MGLVLSLCTCYGFLLGLAQARQATKGNIFKKVIVKYATYFHTRYEIGNNKTNPQRNYNAGAFIHSQLFHNDAKYEKSVNFIHRKYY